MNDEIVSLADKIISILKQRKIVELSDLVKETGADERHIKLIIEILEKEEMVDIGYSLTKVLVSWNDEADRILTRMKKNQKIVSLDKNEILELTNKKNGTHIQNVKKGEKVSAVKDQSAFNIFSEEKEKKTDKKNEEKLGVKKKADSSEKDQKEHKREGTYRIGVMAVKDAETDIDESEEIEDSFTILDSKTENILKHHEYIPSKREIQKNQKDFKTTAATKKQDRDIEEIKKEVEKEIKELEKSILLRIGNESESSESVNIISFKDSDIVKSATAKGDKSERLLSKYTSIAADNEAKEMNHEQDVKYEKDRKESLRELEQVLKEIVNKQAEIAELNKHKSLLFDTTHPELKSKISVQIDALQSLIKEKENKLSKLRDRIYLLPEHLNELKKLLDSLKEKHEKLNDSFNSSLSEIEGIKKKIQEAKSDYMNEFIQIRNRIIEQEKELIRLNDVYSSLKEKEERLANSIKFVKNTISNSQEELINLENQLENFISSSKIIEMKLEETSRILKALNKKFESYANKIKELEMYDKEIAEIREEFRKAKQNAESKIKDYENEILALSKSLELETTTRYLKELERMTADTENSFVSLLSDEKAINSAIEMKKKELAQLIENAKELQRSLAAEYSEDSTIYRPGVGLQSIGLNDPISSNNGEVEISYISDRLINEPNLDSDRFDIQKLESTFFNEVSKATNLKEKIGENIRSMKTKLFKLLSDVNRKLEKK